MRPLLFSGFSLGGIFSTEMANSRARAGLACARVSAATGLQFGPAPATRQFPVLSCPGSLDTNPLPSPSGGRLVFDCGLSEEAHGLAMDWLAGHDTFVTRVVLGLGLAGRMSGAALLPEPIRAWAGKSRGPAGHPAGVGMVRVSSYTASPIGPDNSAHVTSRRSVLHGSSLHLLAAQSGGAGLSGADVVLTA
jgi:hypothetical protein